MRIVTGIAAVAMYIAPSIAVAGYATFDETTDHIGVEGNTVLTTAATYEAVIRFAAGGNVWTEHQAFAEDKQLGLRESGGIYAFSYLVAPPYVEAGASTRGDWHHYAYVYDGAEERLYIDGSLITSRSAGGDISDGPNSNMSIGRAARELGVFYASFLGDIDSLRISTGARYSGASFVPTVGDFANDASALLLFNFNEAPGSATVTDEVSGFIGTLGEMGTLPTLVPEPASALIGVLGLAALALRRR